MKPNALITGPVHPEVVAYLSQVCSVEANNGSEPWPRSELMHRARNARAILAFSHEHVDEEFLEACPDLRIIAYAQKGYGNLDLADCARRRVWVAVVPDLLIKPTADLAVAMMTALVRNSFPANHAVESKDFLAARLTQEEPASARSTVGIVGTGAVGRAIAERLQGLDVRIICAEPQLLHHVNEEETDISRVPFHALLARADFVVLAVPLGPATFHLINAGALRHMKPGAFLINPSRDSVVDERAVADALGRGWLRGYSADAFETDGWARVVSPATVSDTSPGRSVLAPDPGAAAEREHRRIIMAAARQIYQCLSGCRPDGAVNEPAPVTALAVA